MRVSPMTGDGALLITPVVTVSEITNEMATAALQVWFCERNRTNFRPDTIRDMKYVLKAALSNNV